MAKKKRSKQEWEFLFRIGAAEECACCLYVGGRGIEITHCSGGVSVKECSKCGGAGYVDKKG